MAAIQERVAVILTLLILRIRRLQANRGDAVQAYELASDALAAPMMAAPAMAQQNAAAIEYGKELQECSVVGSFE